MLLTKRIDIFMCNSNKKKYREKGYMFSDNELCSVDILDVPKSCNSKVDVKCDNCGKVYQTRFNDYNRKKIMTDYCDECINIKRQNIVMEKYGVDNICRIPHVDEKKKATLMKKYGVEYTWHSKEICDKARATTLKNYGVEYGMLSKEVTERRKQTNMKKYGVEYPFQNKEILQKTIDTQIKKYGGVGRAINTSSQQKYLHSLYGGELNFYIAPYHADILFKEEKIVFEYDGLGHDMLVKLGKLTREEFEEKEKLRSEYLQSLGYKEFHIIADKKDKLPTEDSLLNIKDMAFDYLINQNGTYYSYNLKNNEINKG